MISKYVPIALALAILLAVPVAEPATGIGSTRSVHELERNMNITSISSVSIVGNDTEHFFYSAISGNGDLDGDGFDDLAYGLYSDLATNYKGRLLVLFGGYGLLEREGNRSDPDLTILGEANYDRFGTYVSILGDINGDGFDDLGAISPYHNNGATKGRFYIFFGRSNWPEIMNASDADVVLNGTGSFLWGSNIAPIGDVNRDGIDDFAVSDINYKTADTNCLGRSYIFLGKGSGWPKTGDIADVCSASYRGTESFQYLGHNVVGVGDVNDDGTDDILINSPYHQSSTGTAYLIFGKSSGWSRGSTVNDADVKITGEGTSCGFSIAASGDVDLNGDGIADMVISAPYTSGYRGKALVFFGHRNWARTVNVADADVSLLGSEEMSMFGSSVNTHSDIDGNGINDILIGAENAHYSGSDHGMVFMFSGGAVDWPININDTEADASFHGEMPYDNLGSAIVDLGDFLGQSRNTIGILAQGNDEGGISAGKLYLTGILENNYPKSIISLTVFSDPGFSKIAGILDRGDMAYIEIIGEDSNSSTRDVAIVNVTRGSDPPLTYKITLRETEANSGTYRGHFIIGASVEFKDTMTFYSVSDPAKCQTLTVDTPLRMSDFQTSWTIDEGDEFSFEVDNLGYCPDPVWNLTHGSSWLGIDPVSGRVFGHPDNDDVGSWKGTVWLHDDAGHSESREFSVKVRNVAPTIITQNVLTATEDCPYSVDYSCDEDGEPGIRWTLHTDVNWLTIDQNGVLAGTPTNDNLGSFYVRVVVEDGNGASDSSPFNITVVNENDPPMITTEDILWVDQGVRYKRIYQATDPDPDETLIWSLITDADWLELEGSTLEGTPGPEDVGRYTVVLKVTDSGGAMDMHEFELCVDNVNDAPVFTSIPSDMALTSGSFFAFDVEAEDLDVGAKLNYSLRTNPPSEMAIDPKTGTLEWKATTTIFEKEPYNLYVSLKVTDGELVAVHEFRIKVELTLPPLSNIICPVDEARVPSVGGALKWTGEDPEGSPLTYDVYLHTTMASVASRLDEALYILDYAGTSMDLTGLEQGKRYYWTVIPDDGGRSGSCTNGILSFTVNNAPTVQDMDIPEAKVGLEFKLKVQARDADQDDRTALRYSLGLSPDGMTLGNSTGLIRWRPSSDQSGLHEVEVVVTDGIESYSYGFIVEVQPGSGEGGAPALLLIASVTMVLILVGVTLAFILVRARKKSMPKEDDQDETIIGDHGDEKVEVHTDCRVATTIAEAHREASSPQAPKTYEDLYGTKAPAREDGMSTTEMRDYIHRQIEELEGM